jgi:type I restriction enzyme, S subunit
MALKPQTRIYDRCSAVVFRITSGEFGGLSNMAPDFPLEVNGIPIATTEALYQACRFPDRPDVQALVLDQRSPMTAKMKSKRYRKSTRADWEKVRVKIMRWCLRVKLAQNWSSFFGAAAQDRASADRRRVSEGRLLGGKTSRRRKAPRNERSGSVAYGVASATPDWGERGASQRHTS